MLNRATVAIISYPLRIMFTKQFWCSLAFLVLSFLLGIIWFSLILTLLSLGDQLLIVGIGIPLLLLTLVVVKMAARIERARLTTSLAITILSPYRPLPTDGWGRRALAFASDPALWRDWLYVLLLFPLGMLDFVVVLLAFCAPVGLLTLPLWGLWIPTLPILHGNHAFPLDSWEKTVAIALVGFLGLVLGPYPIIATARFHGAVARRLLGIPLSARLAAITASRTRVLETAVSERQRIERDLHDGAQQHLVALAMDLGMAKEHWDREPEKAHALLLKAHEQAKRSLAELRDLVRGIYPAVLTDRGLDAALGALAGRNPIPITVAVALTDRLPELIEATAYFVVAEALTNITKHSGASQAAISLYQDRDTLILEITDNGHGGASIAAGTGLAGLRDRLVALEGALVMNSPPGGPTHLRGVIPCAL